MSSQTDTEFENHDRSGLICPWCTDRVHILKCQHNPFKMMAKIEELNTQIRQSRSVPYNLLSHGEAERLAKLAEECGEVVQAVGKILAHGYEDAKAKELGFPETNRQALERECGDVHNLMTMMCNAGDLSKSEILDHAFTKSEKIQNWMHHQGDQ